MILNKAPRALLPMSPLRAALLGLAATLAFPAGAIAQQTITTHDLDGMENLLSGYGSVSRETDNEGDPKFKGRINGKSYTVNYYGCDDNNLNCDDIQFVSWFLAADYDATLRSVNTYNEEKRFGKAAIDDDGDIRVTFVVNLRHGINADTMDDNIDWWRIVLKEAEESFAKE